MIRYSLKCADGHAFDSWFQSAEAFDALAGRGLVACVICGSEDVKKAVMAPRVTKKGGGMVAPEPDLPATPAPVSLSTPETPMEHAMKSIRTHLEKHSTYVGGTFADEARAIHLGDAPARMIHGEAKPEDARALIEDGVPIAPVPGVPKAKSN
ncbi:DUF1178 family protein [Rhodophyticola sp. CCM32]|uniref:DUF1178 family protein n=1 Tax=Rhodophyticola sp. CCM32 TaxID=2916397 RepID=UPI00107F8DC5|nr:DUF1178 family protein [Rhodophyticola sp. CCM32]QBY01756.1 DUF1178 family protein [Rhodophyticola sp. CCM32]